jgi:hypothetical protein
VQAMLAHLRADGCAARPSASAIGDRASRRRPHRPRAADRACGVARGGPNARRRPLPRRCDGSQRHGALSPAPCCSARRPWRRGRSRAALPWRLSQTTVCASVRGPRDFHRNLLSQSNISAPTVSRIVAAHRTGLA